MAATEHLTTKWLHISVITVLCCTCWAALPSRPNRVLTAEICGATGFDVYNLTVPSIWAFTNNDTKLCLGNHTDVSSCRFALAFCKNFSEANPCAGSKNVSACVSNINATAPETSTEEFKLGSYDVNKNIFNLTDNKDPTKFYAEFTKGGKYNTSEEKSCNLSVHVEFQCQTTLIWTVPSAPHLESPVPGGALEHISYDSEKCQYSLVFNYAGACPTITPIPSDINPSSRPLSAGTILVIIFFVALTAYCVLGTACKVALGFRGKDVLPHSDFWTMLPVYVADGCLFVCRCCKTESHETSAKYDSI